MPVRITRENERNIRTNDLLQENQADYAANTYLMTQLPLLDAEIQAAAATRERQISKDGGTRYNYALADNAEDALDEVTDEVSDFAGSMTDEFPEFHEKFRRYHGSSRRRKIAVARAFAADGDDYIEAFKARGMEENFPTILRTRADALEQALAEASTDKAERVGATSEYPVHVRNASKIIKAIDPAVRKIYKNNPAKLAAWKFASHVQRDAQPPKPPTPPSP